MKKHTDFTWNHHKFGDFGHFSREQDFKAVRLDSYKILSYNHLTLFMTLFLPNIPQSTTLFPPNILRFTTLFPP